MFSTAGAVEDADGKVDNFTWFDWQTFLKYNGPGFLMCVAYLDPGNLEADLQLGAYTGDRVLWVLLLAHVFGLVFQVLASKLGNVTGLHLAQACQKSMPTAVSYMVYVMIEIAIIGCDIQATLGSGIAWQILLGCPLYLGCVLSVVDTIIIFGAETYGMDKLEAVVMVLVGTMSIAFGVNFFSSQPNYGSVLQGFIPHINSSMAEPSMGILGAVIMPHNIYLHSGLVLSRKVDRARQSQVAEANKYCMIDSTLALFVAFIVNLCVVGCFSTNFFSSTCPTGNYACLDVHIKRTRNYTTYGSCNVGGHEGVCSKIGLRSAGDAMDSSLGSVARYVWAIGLLAAGLSAATTTTYAGQYVMEGFMNFKVQCWKRMTVVRILALIPAVAIAAASVEAGPFADSVGEWINVFQALLLPFALLPLLILTDSKSVMGEFANGYLASGSCWLLAVFLILANTAALSSFAPGTGGAYYVLIGIVALPYFAGIVGTLTLKPSNVPQGQGILDLSCGPATSGYGAT